MSTRSRKRTLREESEDEDRLAPPVQTTDASPLSAAKKRKLNTYSRKTPPKNTAAGTARGVLGKLGSILGYGKENGTVSPVLDDDSGREDESTVEEEDDGNTMEVEVPAPQNTGRRRSVRGISTGGESSTDEEVEDSEDEDNGDEDNESADDEENTRDTSPVNQEEDSSRTNLSSREQIAPILSAAPDGVKRNKDGSIQKKRGRPRKNPEAVPTPKKSVAKPKVSAGQPINKQQWAMLKKAMELSRAAIRDKLIELGETEEAEEYVKEYTTLLDEAEAEEMVPEYPVPTLTPVKRGRGRPRKSEAGLTPKGILTPSRGGLLKSKKSVTFGRGDEVDLGFRDIPSSSRMARAIEVQESDESEASEEIACAICSGVESEQPNEIIFCDNCDLSVHQECYRVPVVPEGDWLCRDCDNEIPPLLDLEEEAAETVDVPSDLPDIEGFERHLRSIQRVVLDKLTGQRRIKLRGHDEELQKVYQVVEQTVLAGEGNSMLVIGARGTGKTTLVESVITDISAEHRDDFHVIRLNGLIHTDDKIALREIWRQLGREMDVEDEVAGRNTNAADTLASLLALLSHPSELSEDRANQTTKSVIFILDEFDLFTSHARQALLYNLFDIAQSSKAPILVLGLTTRVDVVESLEKRVKSRFSHRYVYLSLPRSLPAFWEVCKDGLVTDAEELERAGFEINVAGQDQCLSYWQSMIENLYNDSAFKHHLQSHFYRTKSVPAFFTSCILPIANLSLKRLPLSGPSFSNNLSLTAPDSKLHILQGLSELELALLIAAARLDIIFDTDTCNFSMAYDEYGSLTSRHKIQTSSTGLAALGSSAKIWGRDVALGAWERLVDYELLIPAGIGGGAGRHSGVGGRMWKIDVGLEEIPGSVVGLSGVMAKWCREI